MVSAQTKAKTKTKTRTGHRDAFWKRLATFSSVFASIREAVVFVDADGKIVMANPAIELLTGRLPVDFTGAPAADALALVCVKADAAAIMREAVDGWRAMEFPDECAIKHTNGSETPVVAVTTPLYDDDGAYAGIILVMRDISKDMEMKHQQYSFFSFATHQMRQPLAYLRLGLEGLLTRKQEMDVDQREIMEELLQVTLKSAKFVKEILEVSRLEQGRIDLVMAAVDMRDLLEAIGKEFIRFSESHNVVLKMFLNSATGIPCVIPADAERLKDVFRNLITNAISYNRPKGEVTVDLFRVSAAEAAQGATELCGSDDFQSYFASFTSDKEPRGAPFLIITIADTGLGIPQKDQPFIFRTFFRASNVQKQGLQGTGLGLSIVKSIVERSGGRIGFQSAEGAGTTFYVFFPLAEKEQNGDNEDNVQMSVPSDGSAHPSLP